MGIFQNGHIGLPDSVLAPEPIPGIYQIRHAAWSRSASTPKSLPALVWQQASKWIRRIAILIVPVFLLCVLLVAWYLYADVALPLGNSPIPYAQLTNADFIVPIACFVIQLTNRRHGAEYALAQLIAAFAISAIAVAFILIDADYLNLSLPAIGVRIPVAFAAAFLLSNYAAIGFFELGRGHSGGLRRCPRLSWLRWCSVLSSIRRRLEGLQAIGLFWRSIIFSFSFRNLPVC